ncbi:MAG: flagellar biosynthesis anti-sigma factor FlgM [Planctomyces sp.]|nr:flagellar biosynthesis anti-sigma factor FlgM [Planctomyces sp.]
MQIYRFHTAGQPQVSRRDVQTRENAVATGSSGTVARETEAGGVTGGGELETLTRRLGDYSDVRADVVEEAKVRVQRGDYLTRASAEQTAAAMLSKDA